MRRLAVLLSFVALPVSASNIWFDPPNPTSRTPVVAHIQGAACPVVGSSVSVHDHIVSITVTFGYCGGFPPPLDGFPTTVDLGVLTAGVYQVLAVQGSSIPFAQATLTVGDAAAPFEVQPNVGGSGTAVRIIGNNLIGCLTGPSPVICETPVVKFGDVAATVVSASPQEIRVVAPPQEPGAVDVTVQTARGTSRATAAFRYFSDNETPDPAFFEPVLFPVIINGGSGAFGARWYTEPSIRNENDDALPVSTIFNGACGGTVPCPAQRVGAHSTVIAYGASEQNGYLIFVPRQMSPRLFFGLLVKDLSRQAEDAGTEIPVVREKDFFDRPFSILNVPADSRYRVALRLYRVDGGSSLQIRIWPVASVDTPPLVQGYFGLTRVGNPALAAGYIGDLVKQFPQLAGMGALRIEIDGMSPQRSWAFVSVTNNATQHVTVISPH